MNYYVLYPEVAGEIGENSILTYENGRIKEVDYLDYCFMGWLGDELLTQTPCYIVSKNLQQDIIRANLTGASFCDITVSFSEEFEELYEENREFIDNMPEFVMLICKKLSINDNNNMNYDFYFSKNHELIVSENAMNIISKHKIIAMLKFSTVKTIMCFNKSYRTR